MLHNGGFVHSPQGTPGSLKGCAAACRFLSQAFSERRESRGRKDWLQDPSRGHCFQEHCKGLKPQALTELYPANPPEHPAGVGFPACGLSLGIGCG